MNYSSLLIYIPRFAIHFSLILLLVLISHYNSFGTHIRGGYLRVHTVSNSNTLYQIHLILFTDTGSTVKFGGGEVNYGDGSPLTNFHTQDVSESKVIGHGIAMDIYKIEHNYPGPGIYTISFREFNRNANIVNMTNSVNTPFYVETRIVIDPYFGLNQSPEIMSNIFNYGKIKEEFEFNLGAYDPDGDSLSFELVKCLQDRNVPATNYYVPSTWVEDSTHLKSRLSVEHITGQVFWEFPDFQGEYNAAINIHEWRFIKDLNDWVEMGSMRFDFQIIIWETDNTPPKIKITEDTAVLINQVLNLEYLVEDMDEDSLSIKYYGSVYKSPFSHPSYTLSDTILFQEPVSGIFSWEPALSDVTNRPYSLFIDVTDNEFYSLRDQQMTNIWVVDEESNPDPPSSLLAVSESYNTVKLSWTDNSVNEAGFIVERADDYFPEFRRLVALPVNSSAYTDKNILPNRDYQYKVKVVGTKGSSYSEILLVSKDIILNTYFELDDEYLALYPNPVKRCLFLDFKNKLIEESKIEIYNSSGILQDALIIPPGFRTSFNLDVRSYPSGFYILKIQLNSDISIHKFIKE
ncbi:T9SS type A sorting domain-containing protein [Bacteroidota bacterium]